MSYLCGCYYHVASVDYYIRTQKHYLPLLDSSVHSTILSTTSRTVLKQKFTNPSPTEAIKECIYTFPLYDGVSVVSFTCRIGGKVLRGLVKEKQKAKQIFDDAVAKGETAGLLEQAPEASDVFSTKLGNIPAGQSVIVEITYIGELKHHETEGIRFTIPTKIAPRYGSGPATSSVIQGQAQDGAGIKITVDVNMQEGSFIKAVQSPSHPIGVSMGTVSTASNADPLMSRASATLSLGSTALEKDFVLIVQCKDVGIPKAILETHPTIRHHRAIMATLVPKFSLPPSRPEIVFVADRSGSMAGTSITLLVSAMKVFLKSMPVGVKFNICSFGSSHSFLWPKSQSYTKETLEQATNHIQYFQADMGGTETYNAIKATIDRRYTDIPLEVMLLTDGDIWQQNELFSYVNQQVEKSKGNIRIFPLGIGNGVSHALIEGLARAGNGFAQAAQSGERLDNCVVRMLRGALSPHINNYTLEVKYEKENDDFELIDKVTEGMKVLLSNDEREAKAKSKVGKPKISLFNTSVNPEKDDLKGLDDTEFWLPKIPYPKLYQAPHKIPTLFAFSRTSVYLLLSPDTIQRNPTAVILRATSSHGPLELEIPIEALATPAETIHQLAAKKAVQDLEEGRGWIYEAKDQSGKLVKDRYPSCFNDLVQKEAVRLGEKFQIAGKWASFVAVQANDEEIAKKEERAKEQKALVTDAEYGIEDGYDSIDFSADLDVLDDFQADMSYVDSAPAQPSKNYSIGPHAFGRQQVAASPQAPFIPLAQPTGFGSQQVAGIPQARSIPQAQRTGFGNQQAAANPQAQSALQMQPTGFSPYAPPMVNQSYTPSNDSNGKTLSSLSDPYYGRESADLSAATSNGFGGAQYDRRSSANAPMKNKPSTSKSGQSVSSVLRRASTSLFGANTSVPQSSPAPVFGSSQNPQSQGGIFGRAAQTNPFAQAPQNPQGQGRLFGNLAPTNPFANQAPQNPSHSLSGKTIAYAQQAQPQGGFLGGYGSQNMPASSPFGNPQAFGMQNTNSLTSSSGPQAAPTIGSAPSNLFGGIMAGQGPGGAVPPPPPPALAKPFTPSSSFGQASPGFSPTSPGYSPISATSSSPPPAPKPCAAPTAEEVSVPVKSAKLSAEQDELEMSLPFIGYSYKRFDQSALSSDLLSISSAEVIDQYDAAPTKKKRGSRGGAPHKKIASNGSERERRLFTPPPAEQWKSKPLAERVLAVIALQSFEGSWGDNDDVKAIIGYAGKGEKGVEGEVWVTLLVVKWLEICCGEEEGTWGLVVEKARGWLEGKGLMDLENWELKATSVVKGL